MTDTISVIIPTYNSEKFISQALDSVFKQTRRPMEVLVVDDASTDGTCELVTALAQSAPVRLRLCRLSNNSGGPARPLNVGIGQATGALIATLDHDDLMLPEKLALQVACLKRDERLGLVLSSFYYNWHNVRHDVAPLEILRMAVGSVAQSLGAGCYRVEARDFYAALLEKSMAGSCSNFLFPRRVWAEAGGFDRHLTSCCDYGFMQSVAKGHDVGIVDQPLFYYNWLDDSLYRTARRLLRKRDQLHILRNFEPTLLSAEQQVKLRHRLRTQLLGSAQLLRDEGAYIKSFCYYLESVYRGGMSSGAILGIAKLGPHKLLHSLGATARPIRERLF
jgi:glycosyltransferase involved in cell wall biosynthesis